MTSGGDVGRHRTAQEKQELSGRAQAMRAGGWSRREIRAQLGVGDDLLSQFLAGTTVPVQLRRPTAKEGARARAVELRSQGRTYDEIAAELGVSKSSCSLWLRHLPRPEDDPERRAAAQARRTAALRQRMQRETRSRRAVRDERAAAATSRLGVVTSRDLVIACAVSYWCEGSKRKPGKQNPSLQWMNTDPMLVRLYLEGLRELGVEDEQLRFRLHIHENADEAAARRWWAAELAQPDDRFQRSTIKRHNPRTQRSNVGEGYHGCICVTALAAAQVYDLLRGVVVGLALNVRGSGGWHDGEDRPR